MSIQATWAKPVLITASELLMRPDDVWRYELIQGRLVRMSPTGDQHNRTSGRLFHALYTFVSSQGLGEVYPQESGFLLSLEGEPDTVLAPDLAFVRADRVPSPVDEGFPRLAPDLVAEVLSPSQTIAQLRRKAGTWIAHGVRTVWIVIPRTRTVEVWRVGEPPVTLREQDTLAGDNELEGFAVTVATLFAGYRDYTQE